MSSSSTSSGSSGTTGGQTIYPTYPGVYGTALGLDNQGVLYVTGAGDAGVIDGYAVPGGQYLYSIAPASTPGAPITSFGYEPDSGLLFYGYYETAYGQVQLYPIGASTPSWATNSASSPSGAAALVSGIAPEDGNQTLFMTQRGGLLWQCPSPQSLNGFCGRLAGDGGLQYAALASAELGGKFTPLTAVQTSRSATTYKIECLNSLAGLIPISSQTFNGIAPNGLAAAPRDGGATLFVSDGSQVWSGDACCTTNCTTFVQVSGLDGVAAGALVVDAQGQTLYVADSNARRMVVVPIGDGGP